MAERRGCMVRALLLIVVAGILAAAGIASYWYLSPYRNFGTETFVEIEHGMSSRAIAAKLQKQGVVRSRYAFLLVRALHPRAPLQAGEYRFGSAQTPFQVFNKIARGEIFYEEFTIPEGSNMFDIAGLLRNGDTVKAADFLAAAADPSLIRDLDPKAPNLEGYLFPSTYRVTHKTTAKQLCRSMIDEFRKQWKQLGGEAQNARIHEIVIVASLVEKESASPEERPDVASVFFNRLRLSMPLQCDPTTVYAALLENRYRGTIYKSDLASMNAYNTYTHNGLPPGAIANPGAMSLKAALHPAATNYLYFVAKPDRSGTHAFSATLAEHEKNVEAFRRAQR
ncbi:MAG TPA: endolytic transglycosylase MltG [Bryobacteraceae bacterium]|nr:endolytic transglycosylase MltG [Bryobacteraceae bacterium]